MVTKLPSLGFGRLLGEENIVTAREEGASKARALLSSASTGSTTDIKPVQQTAGRMQVAGKA